MSYYPPPWPGPPAPGKGTAVTAAVLAMVLGALTLLALIGVVVSLGKWAATTVIGVLFTALYGLLTGLLFTGGGMLLARKRAGQILAIVGAGLVVALGAFSFGGFRIIGALGLVTLLLGVATVVFAAVPSTNAWLNAAHPAPGYPPPGYPPPGFPQAGPGYPPQGHPPPGYPAPGGPPRPY